MTPLFDHTFIDNHAPKTLVLLHGTGGDKTDFLFLDELLNQSVNLLALQGNIREQGLPRFFKRLAVGVFDQVSIKTETTKLHEFMTTWQASHNAADQDFIYLGYSNGANMILATMFYFPTLISTAVLLHPMLPLVPDQISLRRTRLFITQGLADPMVSQQDQTALVQLLQAAGAGITLKSYPGGHQLTQTEIRDAVQFLSALKSSDDELAS